MINKRTELLSFGKEFIEKMNENDVWFSADVEMILGAQRHGGFIPWNERLQVIMTPESYTKLKRLFPENVVDSYYDPEYGSLKAAYLVNRDNWKTEQPFVEIRIVVATTLKKISDFKNPVKNIGKALKRRKNNIKTAINDLNDPKFEGFYVVNTRMTNPIKGWIPNITFQMEEMKFNTLTVPVIKEWQPWVVANFGGNYMTAIIPQETYLYLGPNQATKEEE